MNQAEAPEHPAPLRLDHVVLAAHSLAEGVAWCEATFGIIPGAGGEHRFMGTHNRVFSVASPRFPLAYFEIIAIDPHAARPAHARWFGLDDAALQRAIRSEPRLIHWIARCADAHAAADGLRVQGFDPGELLSAERMGSGGLLRWHISVRADGRRLCGGVLPSLIQWGELHPATGMASSGITLESITLSGLPDGLAMRLGALLGPAVGIHPATVANGGAASFALVLVTPRGRIELASLRTAP